MTKITLSAVSEGGWQVIGFLCVDTLKTDTFDPEIDVALGEACAHALHSGLLRFVVRVTTPDGREVEYQIMTTPLVEAAG